MEHAIDQKVEHARLTTTPASRLGSPILPRLLDRELRLIRAGAHPCAVCGNIARYPYGTPSALRALCDLHVDGARTDDHIRQQRRRADLLRRR